jgi:DNA polymerase-1
MEKENLDLIDLDTLLFIVAYNQFSNGNKDQPELVSNHVREFIGTILLNTKASKCSMVYQIKGHSNYRKYFYPDYKAKRPPEPEFITVWREIILDTFKELGAIGVKVIESDDVINIGYNRLKDKYNVIIVSADKDLNQIPGEHYNPRTHKKYTVSESEALTNLYIQVLAGDFSDDVNGIEGIGAKWNTNTCTFDAPRARKILQTDSITRACHEAYRKVYNDTWYSEYTKAKFLVTLLSEINYNIYPLSEEVTELFNIQSVNKLVSLNLFE